MTQPHETPPSPAHHEHDLILELPDGDRRFPFAASAARPGELLALLSIDGDVELLLVRDGHIVLEPLAEGDLIDLRQYRHFHVRKRAQVTVEARILEDGQPFFRIRLPRTASLLDVMDRAATDAHKALLPTAEAPLDLLHAIHNHDHLSPSLDLEQTLGDYLREPNASHRFGIELVRAFRVNARWAVAPKPSLTPRAILALPEINLNSAEFTLYHLNSTTPLPIDTPVDVKRGEHFEAQKDGKYGGA